MKLLNAEARDNYIVRVYLDDNSVIDFDVKSELQRIPCYKPLYDVDFFNTVKFKNRRIYWNDKFDFHLDQILEHGQKNYRTIECSDARKRIGPLKAKG